MKVFVNPLPLVATLFFAVGCSSSGKSPESVVKRLNSAALSGDSLEISAYLNTSDDSSRTLLLQSLRDLKEVSDSRIVGLRAEVLVSLYAFDSTSVVPFTYRLANIEGYWRVQGGVGAEYLNSLMILQLRDPSREKRSQAIYAIGRIGRPAVPSLIRLLQEGSPDDRKNAMYALERMHPGVADNAIPDLIRLIGQGEGEACFAIKHIRDVTKIPLTFAATADSTTLARVSDCFSTGRNYYGQ